MAENDVPPGFDRGSNSKFAGVNFHEYLRGHGPSPVPTPVSRVALEDRNCCTLLMVTKKGLFIWRWLPGGNFRHLLLLEFSYQRSNLQKAYGLSLSSFSHSSQKRLFKLKDLVARCFYLRIFVQSSSAKIL